jgi:hypothetical protein
VTTVYPDVPGVGPVARQAWGILDTSWNGEWVSPISALDAVGELDGLQATGESIRRRSPPDTTQLTADGLRAVLIFSAEPVRLLTLQTSDWEWPRSFSVGKSAPRR